MRRRLPGMIGRRTEKILQRMGSRLIKNNLLADIRMNSAGERKRWRQDNYQHKADGMKKHRKRREIAERIKDGAGR